MEETRRARKKRQTRELIAEAAFRLFAERGFEQTTVAQIAAAADVATKTFFNHFPSKEEVVFFAAGDYYEVTLEVLAGRRPDESIADLLLRTYEEVVARFLGHGPLSDEPQWAAHYRTLVMTVPSVQARALMVLLDLQRKIAAAFAETFPEEIDQVTAAAAIGALMGALQAASLVSHELGHSEQERRKAGAGAAELAMRGLRSL
ncbi:TetR family transcriptional regulator [Nonomuraea sp. NPDC055795]